MDRSFRSIYSHGFARVAVCVPAVKVADPAHNISRTLELARRAEAEGAVVALFPELGISAYSNEDLHLQDALLDGVLRALGDLVEASSTMRPVLVVGAPLRFDGMLFNCGVVIHRGRVLGVVPKSYLPNYREFYERRQFTPGRFAVRDEVRLMDETVPFGADIVFEATDVAGLSIFVELCEDLWVPVPPSTWGALGGATVLCNLSASNITIGKAAYRRQLCGAQSAKCVAAYLYAASGPGESTTDLAWDGHALIYEDNRLLAESKRFAREEQVVIADLDLDRLMQDRSRLTSFNDAAGEYRERLRALRHVEFSADPPEDTVELRREIARFPYVPSNPSDLDARCFEAYNIQVQGLTQRMEATGIDRLVIGVSGGLDSTQAILVSARAVDLLGLPRTNVLGYSMPGFATGERTAGNAARLMDALGVTAETIDIRPSADRMLEDIGHPYAQGEPTYDVTFENVQAGERTSHLFRLANHHGGLVVGTSDLSEMALGWSTYGVGDQMAHYGVNASVPKTLIRHLIRWVSEGGHFGTEVKDVLASILDTEISPELVPPSGDGDSIQSTEAVVGPFELQDFNLYYLSRYGFRPSKVAFMAHHAWGEIERGRWPSLVSDEERRAYDLPTIRRWLAVFLNRFFAESQFKRSAMPNAPKVGSGGSLSPRSDWRAPSDAGAEPWLEELRQNVPA